jgi:UDP-N-acetylmuramate dehydrogenase
LQIEYKENFEIRNYTTFKIGGKIGKVWFPKTQQELVQLLKDLKDYIVLGNCSNVLVSSNGYKGNLILTTEMRNYEINGSRVIADCGVKGPLLAQKACEASLTGFEFMIGFPGTIGGEVFMNASCHGQCISDYLVRYCLYDKRKKEIVYKEKSEMGFDYRKSNLLNGDYIVLGAEFDLKKADKNDIKELMDRNLATRRNIQPNLTAPNAGSVFKNPQNDSAGRLLDKAGVKGLELENVKVWDSHANFIVNKGNATSTDVLELMHRMYSAVKESFTIELQPEIVYIGDKSKKEDELCKILYQKRQK